MAKKIIGSAAANLIVGGTGDEWILGNAGNDKLYGNGGTDTLDGGVGNDILDGGTGNDKLYGGVGNDSMVGGSGNDYFNDASGTDVFNGGLDFDTVDYSGLTKGRGVDVFLNIGNGGRDAAGDKFISIENVTGSNFNDFLWGNSSVNELNGGAGNDYLRGFGGNDILIGGAGTDQLHGDAGDDTIRIGLGEDIAEGGAGFDWLDFSDTDALNIYYDAGREVGALQGLKADGTGDQIEEIEGLRGSANDDFLLMWNGRASINVFQEIDGGAGDDWIGGAVGALGQTARYYGGEGRDVIFLDGVNLETVHLQLDKGIDGISGFDRIGGDKVEVSVSEFGLGTLAAPNFNFIPMLAPLDEPVSNIAGPSFIYETTSSILWFDSDGSGTNSAPIAIARMYNSEHLELGDFVLVA